jgi:protein-L-isoaspartate(D-aspartate) O-methyltransferase
MSWSPFDMSRRIREQMVTEQIERRGVKDKRVLEAMRKIPRELFADGNELETSYYDGPLSIGHGQTISQPYIVAYMTEQLRIKPDQRVLEIGTGSGYQTAILAELAAEVYTVEIIADLSRRAEAKLNDRGYTNIHFRTGDGALGWPEEAPYNAIMVTAAPERTPAALTGQLAERGRMIAPVGGYEQYLELICRKGANLQNRRLIGVRFVPLVGKQRKDEA